MAEALQNPPAQAQSVWALQNQVDDLQSRLDRLQVTMLGVMDKYGPMARLERLTVRNLSMGSLLILLPFAPGLRHLSMKYQLPQGQDQAADAVPNLTDDLFVKIFQKNKFQVSLRLINIRASPSVPTTVQLSALL